LIGGQRHSKAGRRADGWRAPDVHLVDGARHLTVAGELSDLKGARQQSLINHLDNAVIPLNGPHQITPMHKKSPPRERAESASLIFQAASPAGVGTWPANGRWLVAGAS
jgi:hypothetical protein